MEQLDRRSRIQHGDGFPTMRRWPSLGALPDPCSICLLALAAIIFRGPLSMGEPSPLVYLSFGYYLLLRLLLNVGITVRIVCALLAWAGNN